MTGDIVNATTLEVFAPKAVNSITWNGKALHTQRTDYGSLKGSIAAPKKVTLPSFGSWKSKDSLPERLTTYDDSGAAWVGKCYLQQPQYINWRSNDNYRCGPPVHPEPAYPHDPAGHVCRRIW